MTIGLSNRHLVAILRALSFRQDDNPLMAMFMAMTLAEHQALQDFSKQRVLSNGWGTIDMLQKLHASC